ncbi:unnamed protein product, partial [Fusarium graminearum]
KGTGEKSPRKETMDMKESPSKGPDVLYEEGTREAQVRAGQQRARLLRQERAKRETAAAARCWTGEYNKLTSTSTSIYFPPISTRQVDDSVTPEALELLQFVSTTQISSIITQNCGSPIHSS